MSDASPETVWRECIAGEKLSQASANRRRIQEWYNAQPSQDGVNAPTQWRKDEEEARAEYLIALQTLTRS